MPKSRDFLDSYAFVFNSAHFETHLSGIRRPIYFASNRYCCLGEKIVSFERFQHVSHSVCVDTHEGSRHFFRSEDSLVKLFDYSTVRKDINRTELLSEFEFLSRFGSVSGFPELIGFGENSSHGWLVRSAYSGRLLSELIESGEYYDPEHVLSEVLNQLVWLEARGLYHNDLRAWNVLVEASHAVHLIDFGSISNRRADCAWPHDLFLSFLLFVSEVFSRSILNPLEYRCQGFELRRTPEWLKAILAQTLGLGQGASGCGLASRRQGRFGAESQNQK